MNRKILTGLLTAMVLSVSIAPASVHADEEENKCGDNLYWSLENGTLSITGTGPMYDWNGTPDENEEETYAPWFDQADEITSVMVGDGVTSIGDEFLWCAYQVTDVTLPETIESIGDYAFSGTSIEKMTIPDAVKEVGTAAFMTCESLKSIKIGSGVTKISDVMLGDCPLLSDVVIPEQITSIGSGAFSNCFSLTSLVVPDSVTEIGSYAFFRDINLTDLTIPKNITLIEEYTFAGVGMKELVIPDGVKEIGKYAIADAAIEKIVIPDSVDIIRAYGLCSPTNLKEVVFLGHAPKSMYAFLFKDNVINAYYPADDASWTEAKKGQYSGTVTWIPMEPEPEPEQNPELAISAVKADSQGKVVFIGQLMNYDAFRSNEKVIEHGILYIQSTKLGAKTLTVNSAGRTKVSFTGYKEDGSFKYTLKPAAASTKYVIRSYAICKDENGKQLIYYSPEIVASYNKCSK